MQEKIEQKTELIQETNYFKEIDGRFGGEVFLRYSIEEGKDEYGQNRIVFRKHKRLDCGSSMAHSVEENIFRNKENFISFLEDKWYELVIADRLADEFGERYGFSAEDIMHPYDRIQQKLQKMDDISRRQSHAMAVAWMKKEYPDHYEDSNQENEDDEDEE